MTLEKLRQQKVEYDGGSYYVKLKSGESIEGIFAGDPHTYYQVYGDNTEYERPGGDRRPKFKINFLTWRDGQLEASIFRGGSIIRNTLLDVVDEYGLECVYKIKRTGSTKDDTRYSILFKRELTPEEKELVGRTRLLRLEQKVQAPPKINGDPMNIYNKKVLEESKAKVEEDDEIEF